MEKINLSICSTAPPTLHRKYYLRWAINLNAKVNDNVIKLLRENLHLYDSESRKTLLRQETENSDHKRKKKKRRN